MLKKFSYFIYKTLYLIDKVFFFIFKKNFLIWLKDYLIEDSYKTLKILDQKIKFFVPNSTTFWRINTFFSKEPETLKWIDNFDNSNKFIFWDIGSNIGLYSIYNSIKNPDSISKALEPSTSNLRILSRNISLNNLEKRIKIFTNPLTNRENKFLLMNEESFTEGGAMNTFGENFNFEGKIFTSKMKYQILGTNINYLVKNNILEIPDYIKIDVDGIEHLILDGGDMYLNDPKIKSILIEINENFKDQHSSILKIMEEKNFKFYNKYQAYNADKNKKFAFTFNYIFIKKT